jgi:hypothetical protein
MGKQSVTHRFFAKHGAWLFAEYFSGFPKYNLLPPLALTEPIVSRFPASA